MYQYDFISQFSYEKIRAKGLNIQGIECIEDRVIILENDSTVYELIDNSIIKLAELKRLDEDVHNNINIVAHPTSIILNRNNDAFVTNAMEKRSPRIVMFDYQQFLERGYLATQTVKDIKVMEEYDTLHIEGIFDENKSYSILAGNINNNTVLDIYKDDLSKKICRIPYDKNVQNLMWSHEDKKLLIFSNIIGLRGGIIIEHKINFEKNCPFIETADKKIIITTMELEGYTYCQSKHFYAYIKGNDSFILFK